LKTDITVVKASHLQPFISFLDKVGAPLERLLNQVSLHADYFAEQDNLIAEAPFWSLLENASNSQGIEDLGFQVTEQLSLDSYGVFGAKVMQANSLYQALTTFIRDMGQQSNCPPFWLMEQGDFVWFCRLGTQGIKKGHWPIEQHVISLMIQLVRGFTSTTWTPPKVHLQTHTLKGADNTFSFRNSQIVINKAFTGICIPKSLLLNSAVIKPTGGIAVEIANQMTISTVNSHVIKELLMQSCVNQPLNAQQIAKSLGLNVRHMQRLLQKEGSSYRELSEQVLFKQSKIMLSTEQLSVLEVSLALGYSDAANFTRAFKRWSGLSPTQYKQLVN
jgi:AraC-like DNA-binding protein